MNLYHNIVENIFGKEKTKQKQYEDLTKNTNFIKDNTTTSCENRNFISKKTTQIIKNMLQ